MTRRRVPVDRDTVTCSPLRKGGNGTGHVTAVPEQVEQVRNRWNRSRFLPIWTCSGVREQVKGNGALFEASRKSTCSTPSGTGQNPGNCRAASLPIPRPCPFSEEALDPLTQHQEAGARSLGENSTRKSELCHSCASISRVKGTPKMSNSLCINELNCAAFRALLGELPI